MATKRKTVKQRVLDLLNRADQPLTDEEITRALRGNPNTVRPRRIELEAAGLVVPAYRVRTKSGKEAWSWIAADRLSELLGE